MKLENHRDDYNAFWHEVLSERIAINLSMGNVHVVKDYNGWDGIEQPECPRTYNRALVDVSEDAPGKIYWKEHPTILEDLNDRLISPQLMLCGQIENLLIDGIVAPDKDLVTDLISKHYGTETGEDNVPWPDLDERTLKKS